MELVLLLLIAGLIGYFVGRGNAVQRIINWVSGVYGRQKDLDEEDHES